MQVERKITGKKGRTIIKTFDVIDRGFRRNFMIVSI